MMWLLSLYLILNPQGQAQSEAMNTLNINWSSESQIASNFSPILGDIFFISSEDPSLDKNLISEPLPSQWRNNLKISRQQVIEWVKGYIQERKLQTKVRLSLSMPEQVVISKGNSLSNNYLKNLAQLKIKSTCSTCQLHLLETKSVTDFKARPSQAEWTTDEPQRMTFAQNQDNQSNHLIYEVWVIDEVWVTQLPLINGERLTQDKLKVQALVMKWSQAQVALKSGVLPDQYMTVKAINDQSFIKISEVKKNRVVKIGQPMKGILKGEQFSIEISVVARESAAIGDQIKVYKGDTRKELMAKVISDDLVEIIP